MNALTLTQPWAALVVEGRKTYETRSWTPPRDAVGSRIAIHAAKAQDRADRRFALDLVTAGHVTIDRAFAFGLILGEVTILDVVPTEIVLERIRSELLDEQEANLGDYGPGRWAWRLADPVIYPVPFSARGMLGLWAWDGIR